MELCLCGLERSWHSLATAKFHRQVNYRTDVEDIENPQNAHRLQVCFWHYYTQCEMIQVQNKGVSEIKTDSRYIVPA